MPRKMLSPYHPHALFEKTLAGGICDACCGKIPLGYLFRCQCCNLNLDDGCILYEATRKELPHFSHFHPLETVILDGNVLSYLCAICQTYCIGPTYTCKRCHFYLHLQCSKLELPQEVQQPRHPCLLTLRTKGAYLWPFFEDTILYYECENCNFKMDVGEAVSVAEIFEGQKRFRHFSHRHTLVFSEQNEEFGQVNCSACGKPCSALTYGCITCQFFLHQSCIDLPLQIRHILHPCPLTLCIQPRSFSCGDCGRGAVLKSFYFYCKWCDFGMDIECALLTTVKDQTQRQFFHFAHGHPLTLTEIKDEDEISCSSCRRYCSGPAFVCSKCSFILDKSCFELPRKIQHSFHPSHPLTFLAQPFKLEWACNVCCKNITGFSYCCGKCDFKMHNECTQLSPTVCYKGHHHLLHFLDKLDSQVECKTCDSPCDAHVFRCAECNFNLHLLCGPLPCTIRHEYYDPLLLTDSPCQDDTYQFYCDACEKERKPWLPVYHCKDHHFIAEIECVMSEVILTLQGKYGDVELRTLDGGLCGKVVAEKLETAVTEQNSDEQVLKGRRLRLKRGPQLTKEKRAMTTWKFPSSQTEHMNISWRCLILAPCFPHRHLGNRIDILQRCLILLPSILL